MMRRLALWAGAVLFAGWELAGLILWLREVDGLGPGLSQLWASVLQDKMLLVVVTDHLAIAGVALLWVWCDTRRRRWPLGQRLLWAGAFVVVGTPALLGYLAERGASSEPLQPGTDSN